AGETGAAGGLWTAGRKLGSEAALGICVTAGIGALGVGGTGNRGGIEATGASAPGGSTRIGLISFGPTFAGSSQTVMVISWSGARVSASPAPPGVRGEARAARKISPAAAPCSTTEISQPRQRAAARGFLPDMPDSPNRAELPFKLSTAAGR